MKTKIFKNLKDYETWTESYDNCYEYEEFPVVINNGNKIMMDMFTDCKSWKTALRRFGKQFGDIIGEDIIKEWIDAMRECCEDGYFNDTTGWRPEWNGTYSWQVEEIDENKWYIFLNISGVYADYEN